MLTITHTIKHTRQGTQILSHTRGIEQVGVETLQLIHNRTDVLDAVCQFHLHGLFDHTHEGMTMLHGTQVVQTVGQCQRLGIGHTFPHLLDSTMDIAEMRIDALHGLTVEHCLQAKHTVGGRVLGTDVDHIVIRTKEFVLL